MGSPCSHHARHVVAHYGGNFAQFGQHRDVIFWWLFGLAKKETTNPRQFFLQMIKTSLLFQKIKTEHVFLSIFESSIISFMFH